MTAEDDGDDLRTDRGLDRLITFLDAVVAIAITLLVLPLVDLADAHPDEKAGTILGHHGGELALFALSFFVIARMWRVHHVLLEYAGGYDEPFVWINLLWAFTIVVVPFATQLTTHGPRHDPVAVAVYLGTIAANAGCLAVIAQMLHRRPALRRGDRPVDVRPTLSATGALICALILGLAVPVIGYWGTLLLIVDDRIAGAAQRWRRRGGR